MFYGKKNLVGADAEGYKSLRNSSAAFDKLANRNADIVERFFFAGPLRPAARKAQTGDAETFLGSAENDPIGGRKNCPTPVFVRRLERSMWSGAPVQITEM